MHCQWLSTPFTYYLNIDILANLLQESNETGSHHPGRFCNTALESCSVKMVYKSIRHLYEVASLNLSVWRRHEQETPTTPRLKNSRLLSQILCKQNCRRFKKNTKKRIYCNNEWFYNLKCRIFKVRMKTSSWAGERSSGTHQWFKPKLSCFVQLPLFLIVHLMDFFVLFFCIICLTLLILNCYQKPWTIRGLMIKRVTLGQKNKKNHLK